MQVAKIKNIDRYPFLLPYSEKLEHICEKHGVGQLFLFGSMATGKFDQSKSDLDFLVKFKTEGRVGANMLDMMLELEKLFGLPVGLVRERPFANQYFAEALQKSKVLLYEA